jgi:hypothetical protein
VSDGTIESVTTIRQRGSNQDVRIGLIVAKPELRLLARLDRKCEPGEHVRLDQEKSGAIVGY